LGDQEGPRAFLSIEEALSIKPAEVKRSQTTKDSLGLGEAQGRARQGQRPNKSEEERPKRKEDL